MFNYLITIQHTKGFIILYSGLKFTPSTWNWDLFQIMEFYCWVVNVAIVLLDLIFTLSWDSQMFVNQLLFTKEMLRRKWEGIATRENYQSCSSLKLNTRSEEVESFFRSNSQPLTVNSARSIKRRCRSAWKRKSFIHHRHVNLLMSNFPGKQQLT